MFCAERLLKGGHVFCVSVNCSFIKPLSLTAAQFLIVQLKTCHTHLVSDTENMEYTQSFRELILV